MTHVSGEEFLKCLDQATLWQPGMPRLDKPLHEAFHLFENKFRSVYKELHADRETGC
jgi:hypothetical protein